MKKLKWSLTWVEGTRIWKAGSGRLARDWNGPEIRTKELERGSRNRFGREGRLDRDKGEKVTKSRRK